MAEQQNASPVPQCGDRETKEIYVDGICQVHLVNGTVKMDLITINPNGTDQPNVFINSRLVMSLQQFLSSVDVMNNMVEQLTAKGIISKQ